MAYYFIGMRRDAIEKWKWNFYHTPNYWRIIRICLNIQFVLSLLSFNTEHNFENRSSSRHDIVRLEKKTSIPFLVFWQRASFSIAGEIIIRGRADIQPGFSAENLSSGSRSMKWLGKVPWKPRGRKRWRTSGGRGRLNGVRGRGRGKG